MVTQIIFVCILAIVALQRCFELIRSKKNEALLKKQGGKEHAPRHFYIMVLIHTAWFVSMIIEVFLLRRSFYPNLFIIALSFSLLGNWFRYKSMQALQERWTIRIFTLPDAKPITSGIYQLVRHPIYLGVILEIAFIPLLHTAYLTSIIFSFANAILLKKRIREEELALDKNNNYQIVFQNKPRFLPKF